MQSQQYHEAKSERLAYIPTSQLQLIATHISQQQGAVTQKSPLRLQIMQL